MTAISPELTRHLTVPLVGKNSNAFSILGRAKRVVMRSDIENKEAVWQFIQDEATSGDYDHLLQTMLKWFDSGRYEEES